MGSAKITNPLVLGWLAQIELSWMELNNSTIRHIDREQNMIADELSKKGLIGSTGKMHLSISMSQQDIDVENFPFPG